jgi:hypothetical protein
VDSRIVKRMKEVEKVVLQLDETVRSAAFAIMRDYILAGADRATSEGQPPGSQRRTGSSRADATEKKTTSKVVAPAGLEAFLNKFESDRPDHNARAIAAHMYREYGLEPFTLEEVRELATEGGVTIPARVDMTFAQAKHEKKKLFKRAGRGKFRPTVHGEAYFKATYGVRMGRKKRPEPEA